MEPWPSTVFTVYGHAPVVSLPKERPLPSIPLGQALTTGRSVRALSGESVSPDELATISFCSNDLIHDSDDPNSHERRPCPSAGALCPIELYWFALNVAGLAAGLYHYNPAGHYLEALRTGDPWEGMKSSLSTVQARQVRRSACVMILMGVFPRSCINYGVRGYRFVLLEAGHIAQNALLVVAAQGLAAFLNGGFHDDALHSLLDVDGTEEAALYMMPVGQPEGVDWSDT